MSGHLATFLEGPVGAKQLEDEEPVVGRHSGPLEDLLDTRTLRLTGAP